MAAINNTVPDKVTCTYCKDSVNEKDFDKHLASCGLKPGDKPDYLSAVKKEEVVYPVLVVSGGQKVHEENPPPLGAVAAIKLEEGGGSSNVLVVVGCKGCMMYYMVPKGVKDCPNPKCTAPQLLHFDPSNINNYKESAAVQEADQLEGSPVLVVAGCKVCFMYYMVPKQVQDCPKCAAQLLPFGSDVLVVAGCKGCFMHYMVPKQAQACPKCAAQLIHYG